MNNVAAPGAYCYHFENAGGQRWYESFSIIQGWWGKTEILIHKWRHSLEKLHHCFLMFYNISFLSFSYSDVLCRPSADEPVQPHADQPLDVTWHRSPASSPSPLFPIFSIPHFLLLSLLCLHSLHVCPFFYLIVCYFNICEEPMLDLPLDLNGACIELKHIFSCFCSRWEFSCRRTFSPCESDMMREGVAATLFTEGELPYQCVCCHLLHCSSGFCIPLSEDSFTESRQSDF